MNRAPDGTRRITQDDYEVVLHVGSAGLDVRSGNVDVEVIRADGSRWSATFFTTRNLEILLQRYRSSGEGADGRYVWSAAMIVAVDLEEATILTAIDDLMETQEFTRAFEPLED